MTTDSITTIKAADLMHLRELLETQRVRRLDAVVQPGAISFRRGQLAIPAGVATVMDEDGVTDVGGDYRPTGVFDDGLGELLGVPRAYLRKLRDEGRLELLDQTFNGLLHGTPAPPTPDDYPQVAGHDKNLMLRMFRGDRDGGGVARAVVSSKYRPIDNLDLLVATLNGVREAGVNVEIGRCDVTERKMYVQVNAPEVAALAPQLLKGYRSPFSGQSADALPVIFAGFVISNSEVGCGAASIVPRLTVQVCKNGMTVTKDAWRQVHIGGKRDEGLVEYAEDTMAKDLELMTLKARDAVKTFINVEYVEAKIAEMELAAGVEVTHPEETIKAVVQAAGLPKTLTDDVFAHFIKGGQLTAGGVMQAVTATAQGLPDADAMYDVEGMALDVLAHAARLA